MAYIYTALGEPFPNEPYLSCALRLWWRGNLNNFPFSQFLHGDLTSTVEVKVCCYPLEVTCNQGKVTSPGRDRFVSWPICALENVRLPLNGRRLEVSGDTGRLLEGTTGWRLCNWRPLGICGLTAWVFSFRTNKNRIKVIIVVFIDLQHKTKWISLEPWWKKKMISVRYRLSGIWSEYQWISFSTAAPCLISFAQIPPWKESTLNCCGQSASARNTLHDFCVHGMSHLTYIAWNHVSRLKERRNCWDLVTMSTPLPQVCYSGIWP